LSLTAFITVLFLSGVFLFMALIVSQGFAEYQAENVSYAIQKEINTGNAVKMLGISGIEEIDQNNPRTKAWIEGLDKSSMISGDFFEFSSDFKNKICITIEVHDKIVYTNEIEESEHVKELSDLYKNTEAIKPILDSNSNQIGTIRVRVNPQIIATILIIFVILIIFFSVLVLIIAKILSLFLSIPIINPINQLEKKVRAIADGDQETATNTQLVLKRPLREIESLVDSTNKIMRKLHGYNEMLENQKEVLENQNAELEVQNDELIESKQQIEKQQAQLIQSEKMASVGLLTAAITHEINTPIGAINSNAQLGDMLINGLLKYSTVQLNEELTTMFTQLKEVNDVNLIACSRIIEIIKSLKSFSRLDQAEFQEANINEGIKSVLVLTHNLLKSRITVHENYGDLPLVKCFPGQLNQVLMNIIVNASQAIEGEGDIFIRTLLKEKHLYITISDTGTGIKDEDLRKIFEPGFTTKGVGVGLGLGLYLSYNIIQNHNGEISVVSEPSKGTEFTIKIPINYEKT